MGSPTTRSVAISFAQVASADAANADSNGSVSYPAAQTLGDMNVVVVGWNDTTATVQSVKDSAGNTYSLAIGPTSGTGLQQSIYYAANIAGGQQYGDGDVQPGGGVSGCAHSGVPGSDGAGCDGRCEREQHECEQRRSDDDQCE